MLVWLKISILSDDRFIRITGHILREILLFIAWKVVQICGV